MKIIKLMVLIISIATIGMYSCKKGSNLIEDNNKWVYLDTTNTANIKILQVFAGNTPQLPTAANLTTGPQVFIYANGQKLNGLSLGYGSVWPTTSVYGNIPSGSVKFDIVNARLDLTVVPNVPKFIAGDTLGSFTATLDKGKFYSLYIGDTVPSVRLTLKEDILVAPNTDRYKIRFANFSMNNNPTDTFNIFSRRENAEIITNITHKNVSDWIQLPVPILSDTFELRKKGSTTTYISATLSGQSNPAFSPAPLRMYTIVVRGKTNVTAKTNVANIFTNR
jgi:hypothetical protein